MEELERSKQILNKELGLIATLERLNDNPDFKVFKREIIDKKISELDVMFDEIDIEKQTSEAIGIHNQKKALRGIQQFIDLRLGRKAEVQSKLAQLNN